MESCRPRKLDPGLKAVYSMPRAFRRSTMTSEPYWACGVQGESGMGCSFRAEGSPFRSCDRLCWQRVRKETGAAMEPLRLGQSRFPSVLIDCAILDDDHARPSSIFLPVRWPLLTRCYG